MEAPNAIQVVFRSPERSAYIDFSQQTSLLLSTISPLIPNDLLQDLTQTTSAGLTHKTLSALAKCLAIPAFTAIVGELFSPLLIELCSRWLEDESVDEVARLEALALLLEPCEEVYPIVQSFLSRPSLSTGPLGFLLGLEASQIAALSTVDLHRILLTYYRLIRAEPDIPKLFNWPSKPLLSLLSPPHPDLSVRALAIECYALHESIPDEEKIKTSLELLGPPGEADIPIFCGETVVDGLIQPRQIDGWLLPLLEPLRVSELRARVQLSPPPASDAFSFSSELLHSRVANVGGVLLYRITSEAIPPSPLVETSGSLQALKPMALQLSRRVPTLITSPPGSGKSLLIQHLATLLFPSSIAQNQVVTIHLSDTSLDAKSLLGSYTSSATMPGTFEWVEGTVVRAMRAGKWLVFKDVDKASAEVLGMTLPLVESLGWTKSIGQRAAINVPGRGRVEAADSFMLFATRSVAPTSLDASGKPVFPSPSFLGNHHWNEVQATAPSYEEQEVILGSKFPKLAGSPLRVLLDIWKAIQEVLKTSPKASGGVAGTPRDVGPRDLEKWVRRVDGLLPADFSRDESSMDVDVPDAPSSTLLADQVFKHPSLREEIFDEAKDVFFGFLHPSSPALANFAQVVGGLLGLTEATAQWRLTSRTPEYEVEKSAADGRVIAVRVGHTKLLSTPTAGPPASLKPFALHRPSLNLLARLCAAVPHSEPVLLVGETGTGKTTAIQHLAQLLCRPLTVINLSNQTASSDLLGGFKPIDARVPGTELQQRFVALFTATFSLKKNEGFLDGVGGDVRSSKWKRVVKIWKTACASAKAKFDSARNKARLVPIAVRMIEYMILTCIALGHSSAQAAKELDAGDSPRKRRKTEDDVQPENSPSEQDWKAFEQDVTTFEAQHILAKSKFVFTFVEGPLIKALRQRHWVLLDEINLASSETLEAITPLLQSPTSSITLTEQGSLTPIPRHASFRIFASMNPATDVGKKDLPPNLRSRFTELWVPPPDDDKEALLAIVKQYIGHCSLADPAAIMDVAEFYTEVRRLTESRAIADGSNKRPHFSMRTLARALTFTADVTPVFGLRRALWEGCLMAFTMTLDAKSANIVKPLAERWILRGVKNVSSVLSSIPMLPKGLSRDDVVQVGPFWLQRGPLPLQSVDDYILTPSVQTKLIDLSRIILTRRFPVLIEGPTSAGKTSAIEYLARRTGHRFVRINNHEHTDIQEYLGTYVSDPDSGKLVFHDGLLVRALREGHWIVLDELNLAPTDVLESLNRLLDDNRELVIPETQEIVRPHPSFMLFATQNPAGLYGGRKVLSRAFRNRFLEVHFTDVPQAELEVILAEKCKIPPSRAQRIVAVFEELQKRRQTGRVFETKQGFATLRDLFRWANRDWKDKEGLTNQDLAEDGYMLLAERARNADDKAVVKEVLETVLKVKIDDEVMYRIDVPGTDLLSKTGLSSLPSGLVWTQAFQRLFVLVSSALKHNEPVLLVGETGCGKTSVCELFARAHGRPLYTLNCHQNTETADLLGGQRPLRNRASLRAEAIQDALSLLRETGLDSSNLTEPDSISDAILRASVNKAFPPTARERVREVLGKLKRANALFEWHDGPLVEAMRNGGVFLLDEISLADDSVLERLNSVLEPGRTLTLAEKGGWDIDRLEVAASPDFKLVATMNPGGDYGKKELSPALRNRFTEIWVPLVESRSDKMKIVETMWHTPSLKPFSSALLDFCQWLSGALGDEHTVGLRDIIAWVEFTNAASLREPSISSGELFHHAAHMTLLDGLASLPQTATFTSLALANLEREATSKLNELVPSTPSQVHPSNATTGIFHIEQFGVSMGPHQVPSVGFNISAPTTRDNAARVLRACQVQKPILLEGSPGVGKSSLIAALANFAGHRLCRINLSDQTDLMDLYGSDLPVEGGKPGEFVWKDAAFLRALQEGDWVLLDEMNLAPQAVLEGLNAVLDHRGTVYIPELGRSFTRHPNFRIFAAQNPLHQGGGRKGLPKSFLNRFTKVYVRELSPSDYHLICAHLFPAYPSDALNRMITFNGRLHEEVMVRRSFGREGSPWEFNLRDLLRWLSLMHGSTQTPSSTEFVNSVYLRRFRNETDRLRVWQLYADTFNIVDEMPMRPAVSVTSRYFQIGHTIAERLPRVSNHPTHPLRKHTSSLEAMSDAVRQGSLVIISGKKQSGKTSLVRLFASISGVDLQEFSMHPAVDTGDLLGSFEQLPHQTFDSSNSLQARFGWIDGPLVTAIKQGQWLLLDNANLCNPSVLDRLNSLCETNGSLVLSERGLVNGEVQVLTPHSNFRLFMVMDPQHGELSRAMRNRGVEITVDSLDDIEDAAAIYYSLKHLHRIKRLVDQASLDSEPERRSLLEYALRSSTADQLPVTQRLLSLFTNQGSQGIPLTLPHASNGVVKALIEISASLKGQMAQRRGVPSAFLLSQPIDVLLNTDLTAAVGDELAFATTIVLDAAECLFRQFGNPSLTALNVSGTRRSAIERSYAIFVGKLSQAEAPKGLAEIYPLIKAIQDASPAVLSGLETRLDQDAALVLRTTNSILAFAQQLVLVTQSRELDYSAIQTIATWFCEIRPAVPRLLDEVFTRAEQLRLSTSTTTGQAMGLVWRSRLLKVLPQQLATNLQTLDTLTMQSNQEQRQLAFDLMAVATLGGNVAASAKQVEEMLNALGQVSSPTCIGRFKLSSSQHFQEFIEAELTSSSEKIYIAIIESRALHSSAYMLQKLKQFPWESGQRCGLAGASHSGRPNITLQRTSATSSLAKLTDYEKRLTRITSLARIEFEDSFIGQNRLLAGVLLEQVGLFFETFASSYDEAAFAQIQQDLFRWSSAVLDGSSWSQPQSLSTAITSSSTRQLVEVYDRMLRPALGNLVPVPDLVARVAKGFVSIGLSTLALYVPDAPLDPIVAQRCARDFWEREERMLKARILVNRRAEHLVTGNGSNLSIMELEKRLQAIHERLDGIGTDDIGREPDVKRLHALFTELHQFCQDIVGQNRVEELVAFIETSSSGARQREATFQGSVHGFLQRLETTYSDLSDIATPFAQAVELIRFGIRILLEAGDFDDQLPECVSAMLACPPATAFPSLRTIDLEGVVRRITSTTTRVDLLVHNLRLAAQDRAAGLFGKSHLAVITERYDQLLRLWLDDQEAEQKEAQEASSLYRQRKQDQVQLSDEELEEREFNQLFPKFTDEAQESPDTEHIPRGPRSLSPKVHRNVFELHQELFSEEESHNLAKVDSRDVVTSAAALLQDLGGSHRTDEDTVCARLLMLQDRLHFIQNANLNEAQTFDFYHDSNVPETRKVIALLGEFIKRADELLAEWPEQLVLRHLKDRAEEILDYSMDSPVAKVLSALERLLLHTEDWERYAHKGNSLKAQQQAITAQIVEWRRLELSCWSRLLEVQASTFASTIDVWWFRLYEAAVHGSMAAAKSSEAHAVDQHIQKLSPLLDQYMVGSPSGQYSSRLLLLSTFANFTHQVIPLSDSKTGAALERVATLLLSTHEYWKQFEPEL
ncbi:hypothetical protein FRC00_004779, partial [Tulasnella sp. 408]